MQLRQPKKMNVQTYNRIKTQLPFNTTFEMYKKALVVSRYSYPENIRCRVDEITLVFMVTKYLKEIRSPTQPVFDDYVGGSDY